MVTFNICLYLIYPSRLSIWVSDMRHDLDLYVELVTVTGETIAVGDIPAYCDMESTFLVDTDKQVKGVSIMRSLQEGGSISSWSKARRDTRVSEHESYSIAVCQANISTEPMLVISIITVKFHWALNNCVSHSNNAILMTQSKTGKCDFRSRSILRTII